MGMGAQNRGATGAPAPTQMAMQGGAAPQGLMALMQQRGKGAGMPGGVPQGGPGTGKPDPQLLAAMQAFQQQGGQGSMPGAPGKGAGMPDPGGMPGGPRMGTFGPNDMPVQYDPRKPDSMIPGGVPVQRPLPVGAGGKGTGMPPPGMVNPPRPMPLPPGLNRPMPMPMPPGNMGNPPPFKIMPKPTPRPQPVRPKEFGGFR